MQMSGFVLICRRIRIASRGGDHGRIRLEDSETSFRGSYNSTPLSLGRPLGLFPPPNAPSVCVLGVGGVFLRSRELTLARSSLANVIVEARNIPPATSIDPQFFDENGQEQTVPTRPL